MLVFHLRHVLPDAQIKIYSSARDFLTEVDPHTIDLLFLNMLLPDISGFDVLRFLHVNNFLDRLHVVISLLLMSVQVFCLETRTRP